MHTIDDRVHGGRVDASRRPAPGEFTFAALATGGIAVLAIGNTLASGEPALALLAAFAVSVLVLGVTGACWSLRGVSITVDPPTDGVAGHDVVIGLRIDGLMPAECSVRLLDPPTDWHDAGIGDDGTIAWLAPRRGVWRTARAEIRTSWPFGMFVRRKVFTVELANPMYIVPSALATDVPSHTDDDEGTAAVLATPLAGDLVRGVRPYRAGDAPKTVHWPSTARLGALHVREFEPTTARDVTIRVELSADPAIAEPAAARAMGAGSAVLRSGRRLVLATHEGRHGVVARVATTRELGRRLARATPGAPPPVDLPGVVEIA